MVTAYDHPSAQVAEAAGVDLVLVGDSRRQQRARLRRHRPGHRRRAADARRARCAAACATPLLVGDLPFGSYEASDEQAIATAHRFVKEAGCDAVKLEGAASAERARAIVARRHPGHGPRRADAADGDRARRLRAQGRTAERATAVLDDALDAPGGGLLRDRLRGDPRRRDRRDHGPDGDPGDRHRRRRQHRRPGARAARPARHQRRLPAEVRQALRRRARRDAARAGGAYTEEVRTRAFPAPEHSYGDRAGGADAAEASS